MYPPFAAKGPLADAFQFPQVPLAHEGLASLTTLRQAAQGPEVRAPGSERRRLWQLPAKFHCPVVGVCFDVGELRPWVIKALRLPSGSSDYELHVSAVSACASRTPLAESLQKRLEKRFQSHIRRFTGATTRGQLLAMWRDAVHHGIDIPGALWASWTHPACDVDIEQTIFRDIHMIQHQVANASRVDRSRFEQLRQENTELRSALEDARRALDDLRQTRSAENSLQNRRIAELRAQIIAHQARHVELEADNRLLRQSHADPRREAALQQRLRDADGRIGQLATRVAQLEHTLASAARQPASPVTEAPPEDAAQSEAEDVTPLPTASLEGKCVLCVGGRTGLVDNYKGVVERRGGRFLHHDGGQEDNLQRIDSALSAADLVICQAGCISHNAYWRVKEQCKRTGKPCVFVKTPGTASFGRALDTVELAPQPAER